MKKTSILNFFLLLCITCNAAFAQMFSTESTSDYYRLKFFTDNGLLKVSKINNIIYLKTLNNDIYSKLSKELGSLDKNEKVVKVEKIMPREGNNVFQINIHLNKDVEVFSFYKEREKAHFIDLWEDKVETKSSAVATSIQTPKKRTLKTVPKTVKRSKVVSIKPKKSVQKVVKPESHRDYRYGAPFIWNYEPSVPRLERLVDLRRKTPEFFFPVADRDFEKDDKEAHMQLSINFYKKAKYGLMYKSIKLYTQKYGEDTNFTFNEYLKANALLRESRDRDDLKPVQTAIAMYSNIVDRSETYELRKGVSKYLIQYFLEKEDYVQTLKFSKRFFTDAKENFDYEELESATEYMFHCLSKLNQFEQIEELAREKTILKIMPPQKILAYELYTSLKVGKEKQTIKIYNDFVKKYKGKVSASILFNAAEANFRLSNYEEAIKLYDKYLNNHSYDSLSSRARVRIAHAYEILGRDISKTLELYKNAINRSQDKLASLEARIRYVALSSIRKIKPTKRDLEERVFLEYDEKLEISDDLKHLLWITRLRTLIVDKEYNKALSFLTALPLTSLKPELRKSFQADGAEIIYGIIQQNYLADKFSRAIRAWEIYKDIYINKVANDPVTQFIVAKSYLNLGLWNGFEKVYAQISKNEEAKSRSYPLWVARVNTGNRNLITKELRLIRNIKLKNWDSAKTLIFELSKSKKYEVKGLFYDSLVKFENKEYSAAEKQFEKFFSNNANFNLIDGKDLLNSVRDYLESIYLQGKNNKYIEVSSALVKDIDSINNNKETVNSIKERVSYLRTEIFFSELSPNGSIEAKSFLENYPKSEYTNRVKYLYGRNLIKANKEQEGEEYLKQLIAGEDVAPYIKEMARSELTLLNLKRRSI